MSTMEPLTSLDRSTLRERALGALRAAITSGRYRPGDHLGEVELAGGLGISRGTVREALRHLEQEGLVEAGPRGRLRVNSLSGVEIRGLYQVRAALEGLAATTVIRSPRRAEAVAALRAALDELAEESSEFTQRVEADLAFHLLLCQLADNPMLVGELAASRGTHPGRDHEPRRRPAARDHVPRPARAHPGRHREGRHSSSPPGRRGPHDRRRRPVRRRLRAVHRDGSPCAATSAARRLRPTGCLTRCQAPAAVAARRTRGRARRGRPAGPAPRPGSGPPARPRAAPPAQAPTASSPA